jgi:hypothetical protein
MILVFESTQNQGLQQSVRESFSKGLLGADPRASSPKRSPLVREEEDDGRGEELSILLLGWLCSRCKARAVR